MTRHMFASGNTPIGFVNFFDYILPLENAEKRYFLKGSSGSGKSTFMKKISAEFETAGFDLEHFHCSNDSNSLDGISVKTKRLCIIDGTSPHARDPEIPAGIDKMIDFSEFIDEQQVARYTDEIKTLLCSKKLLIEKYRGYFSAAGNVYTAERTACEAALNRQSLKALTWEWMKKLVKLGTPNRKGVDRRLFLSAVTPDGVISYADDMAFNGYTVYGLIADAGIGTDIFLAELRDTANMNGINTESFYCPFEPSKLEYLALPEDGTAFATAGSRYGYTGHIDEKINFNCCFNKDKLDDVKYGIDRGDELFNRLLENIIDLMRASRQIHNRIENIYISAMDFRKVEQMTERIVRELLPKN